MECLCTDLGARRRRTKARVLVSNWLQTALGTRPLLVESTKLEKRSCSSPRLHSRLISRLPVSNSSIPPGSPVGETLAVDGNLKARIKHKQLQPWDSLLQLKKPVETVYRSPAFETLEHWHSPTLHDHPTSLQALFSRFWRGFTPVLGSSLAPGLLSTKSYSSTPLGSLSVMSNQQLRPQRFGFGKKAGSNCLTEALSEAVTPVNVQRAESESPDCLVASFEAGRSVVGLKSERVKQERGSSVRPSRPHLPPINKRKPSKTPERRPNFQSLARGMHRNTGQFGLRMERIRQGGSPMRPRHSDNIGL